MMTYAIVYFGTALLAMLLVPMVSRAAKYYNLVDAPGPRKVHQNPIPRVGGVVFVVATLALVLLVGVTLLSPTGVVLAAAAVVGGALAELAWLRWKAHS